MTTEFSLRFDVDEKMTQFGESDTDSIARTLESLAKRIREKDGWLRSRHVNIMSDLDPLNLGKEPQIIGTFVLRDYQT